MQSGVSVDEQGHRSIPITPHQQVRVIPGSTDDLTVGVYFTHQIFWVHFGVFIVHPDAVFVVRVEPFADFRNVAQAHGPQICVAFVHRAVVEAGVEAVVEVAVDAMAVFVPHHVGDQRGRIAAAPLVVEVDALAVIKGIAFAGHIDVGWKRPIQIGEIRHQRLHVIVDENGRTVR